MAGQAPRCGHSGAARAGMANLTQTAAFEWAHAGVRVNAQLKGVAEADLAIGKLNKRLKQNFNVKLTAEQLEARAKEVAMRVIEAELDASLHRA